MAEAGFGWELFLRTVQEQATSKNDLLVAFIHFFLLKNNFRNIGIGDDRTLTANDQELASELLPDGWNQMESVYKLRYLNEGKVFTLHVLPSEGLLIANLLSSESLDLSNVVFNVEETIGDLKASAKTIIKSYNATVDKLKTELLEPVYKGKQKGTGTQTEPARQRSPPDARPDLVSPLREYIPPGFGFPRVGGGDLDPLGRLGPGNLFEPPRNPLGGRGSLPGLPGVPPGARFDPFGPRAGFPQRFEPNPDHQRPPGYDDMFM